MLNLTLMYVLSVLGCLVPSLCSKRAVEFAMKVGLALNCNIVEQTQFHRKNYYYPDLPKGFQTTQYDYPIASRGKWSLMARTENA
jgi:aspartyl-tRNA(Asn)/glutamyl-tRNA(Gln) amidotransferase subunit B